MICPSQRCSKPSFDPTIGLIPRVNKRRIAVLLIWLLALVAVVKAQNTATDAYEKVAEIKETSDVTVFGLGQTIKITGNVKQGAISFGGDVIVAGTVDGDVASIGGSVIQLAGSKIGGDVIVLGGTYQHDDDQPNRGPTSKTMMYAGYQQELRNLMRNPTGILRPSWSPGYFGLRILAVLFWFIVSLAFTAVMPATISRGVARLQLTSLRVALIGLIGSVVISVGVVLALWTLPETLSVLVGLMVLVLLLMAGLFGRVIIYAATGRWLQRRYLPIGKQSEAVALLLGSSFWVLLTSLPYLWPFVVSIILVLSLGLALTARYRLDWRRAQDDPFF